MTSTLESPTRPPNGPPPVPPDQTAPITVPRKHSAGHIVAIVIGCLMLLPGLGILAGGGALAIAQAAATDDDGYFRFTLDRVDSDGVAVATTDLWLEDVDQDAGPWVFDFLDLDVRLRVEGAETTDDVFVGIARSADVERYLSKTSYSEIVEIDHHTPRYRQISGIVSVDLTGGSRLLDGQRRRIGRARTDVGRPWRSLVGRRDERRRFAGRVSRHRGRRQVGCRDPDRDHAVGDRHPDDRIGESC